MQIKEIYVENKSYLIISQVIISYLSQVDL